MPAKNRKKIYLENTFYHIYNRGVEKRKIFQDEQDYAVFLCYLKNYLLPKNNNLLQLKLADPQIPWSEKDKILKLLRLNNFHGEITLIAYCLMPNHLHLLVKQKGSDSIDKFMNSLCTRYTMYFNRKYKRVGSLYQGPYKAVPMETDEQLLHLTRYIHKQAQFLQGQALQARNQPCSYPEYIGQRKTEWIKPAEILAHFAKLHPTLSYRSFMTQEDNPFLLEKITLE